MGQLQMGKPEIDRQMSIPGIATALQPRGVNNFGLRSMMDFLMKVPEPIVKDDETITSSLSEDIGRNIPS